MPSAIPPPPPPASPVASPDEVRAAARAVLRGWIVRYRAAAVGVLVFVIVVVALPSTSPNATVQAAPVFSGGRAAAAPPGASVAGLELTAPSTTVVASAPAFAPSPALGSSPMAAAAPEPIGVAAPPPEAPPIPSAPACPAPIPPASPPPSGLPQLFAFFPLAGPFGPEALAFLPVIGPFLVVVTPLFPVLQPGLDASQPTFATLLPLIEQLEQIVFAPAQSFITAGTPQWLAYEKQLVTALEPVINVATDNPAVICVAQLETIAVAKLKPASSGGKS